MLVTYCRLMAACRSSRVISVFWALCRIDPPGSHRVNTFAFLSTTHADTSVRSNIICIRCWRGHASVRCRASRIFFSELVSGCTKIISSVNWGRLREVSKELFSFVFAPDCPLIQAFYLDLLIAVCIVFCRPDQCSLTNSYVDNNSCLISE
jgi:hypothetical protein